ncbi:MAG: hypothetical protein A2V70_00845 [Planctomycetes bacterium RBG_13_63_9]|nr:MAG: hypothetical protein A2V70_00845 [Planctomycetes bacterium RBG_13_63_9]
MSEEVTATEAIEFAIATEEMGVLAYTKLAEKFSDQEEISAAFSLLARDEKAHRAQFQALLAHVPPDEGIMTKDEKSRYLRAMAMSEFFRGDAGLIGRLDRAESVEEALVHVVGFEKATLGYYLAVKDVIGESDALESIIQAEKGHIVRLMKYVLTGEKMKGLGDPF